MRYGGWLFARAEQWRNEAEGYRERYGGQLKILETVADELEGDLRELMSRTVRKDQIATLTGFSSRQVDRWIEDGKVRLNENGEAHLIELPVKPGHLPALLGLGAARSQSEAPLRLEAEHELESGVRPRVTESLRRVAGR